MMARTDLERIVTVSPAYDQRDPDPSKNYGIGGMRMSFLVKGPLGAIQFVIGTDWYPKHIQEERRWQPRPEYGWLQPAGWDVGYHAHAPQYEGQTPMKHNCAVLGGQCFYDGSSLQADEWRDKFLEGGTDWLWPALEAEYRNRFEAQP